MSASLRTVLVGLRPGRHLVCRYGLQKALQPCPSCVAEETARVELAALLRPYSDGWGNLDVELLMRDLAEVGDPRIIQEILG